jgi:hypothetical protein
VKFVPTFADRGCRVVSATDPHSRILGFVDRLILITASENISEVLESIQNSMISIS